MYRMLYNDSFLFDPFDETRIVSSASITTNVNAASYLDFTIAATHPLYDTIEQRSGTITLYSDNEKLFQGQITSIDMDIDGNKSVTCSSALDWLKDVQLRPYSTDQSECDEYEFKLDKAPDSLDAYFQWLIDQYNTQNKDDRYFAINVNQAADLTNRNIVYFASTSPRSVADAIEEDILKTFGGYLVLRYEDDRLILDLYSDIHEMNEQIIDYGENILDISRSESTDDQYTAVYPIGATPQYTAEQQKYHDEKDAYDARMKQRDEAEKAAIAKLQKEEEAEQNRINGMPKGQAKTNAQNALKRRKEQRQARENAFSDETKRLQDEQKIKDDKNAADKTKPNPITIESLNNGGYPGDLDIFKEGDVVYSVSHVARYGYKEFVYSESDVHDKNELLTLAVSKLKTLMAPMLTIDVRAVDQALYNPKHRHLFAGQAVRVRSKAHNVDEFMMVSAIDLDLIDPSQTTATLGVEYDTLTGQQSSFLRNLNSQIVASVDAVDKLGENVKVTEITLGKVETVVENTNNKADLIINTVDDYKWITDTAWGKADDAQADADKANQGVTDTNIRIDGIETDISGINDSVNNTKAEIVTIKENAEQIRQDAQAGIDEAKQQAEAVRTEANTAIDGVKTDLAATEAKAELARQNASSALGGLSSAQAQINGLRIDVNRHQENITNIDGEIVGVKDTISGVSETANSALTVATTNTQAINEQSTRIDTAYSDIEATRTSVSEVKQTADGLKVNLETNYLDKDALGENYASKAELTATSESITSTVEKTYATKSALEGLQNIADAAIETWSGRVVPTASNAPASTWTTDALKRQHSGDIYYDMSTGKSYRWGSEDGKVYSWSMIADSDITKAIADTAKAQQTADGAKQDVVNLSNDVKATYTSKSEFKQTSDEIKASVSEVASANETNAQKIAEVSVKADGISAKVEEQAETISGHTTTIGQLSVKADGLQTKFEQVSDDLDHVRGSIPGLINPNFADGDYGWIHNGASFSISTQDASLNGPYLVGENFSENGTYELINKGLLSLTPGHKYRISILMSVSTDILRDNGLVLRFLKDHSSYSPYPNAVAYIYAADIANDQFVTYSREITCPDKVTQGYFRLGTRTNAGSNSYISVKSVDIVDITEGSAALTKASELELNLNGFKQTVTESYLKKGDAETKYTSKSEFTQTANEIKGTVAEQATTINGHTDSIASLSLKANKFETDITQVTEQATAIAGRTTKLEQDLGGFKQTVSGTYITKTDADKNLVDAINGMQIGGTNMLLDTRAFGSANPNNVSAHGFSLNYAAQNGTYNQFTYRRIPDTVTTNNPDGPAYNNISIERGKTYTASFYYRGTADLDVYFYGPNGYVGCVATTASNGFKGTSTYGNDGKVTFAKDSEWKRYWVTWTLHKTAGSHLNKHLLFRRKGTAGYIDIAGVKLEEGTKATEWSPSPFDTLYASTISSTYAPKTMVEQTEDRITQTVEATYATKDLVNRSIPGLKNPNFDVQKNGDNTITGWSVLGPWAEARLSNSLPVSSEGGTYFTGKSGTTAGRTLELINQGYISAYPGMKVQISWWMFVDSKIIQNSNFSAGIIANNVVTHNQLWNYSTSGWKYMTTTVTVPENVNQFRVRFAFATTGTSGWLRLDSVSVTDVTESNAAMAKATTVETNLEHYKTTVSNTYADKNTVTNMQTQWDQTAQGFEASIKASSSSISVINPGFETGDTTGWTATNFKNILVSDGSIFQNTTYRFLGYRNGNNMPKLENEGTVTARKNDYIKASARILFLDGSNNSLGGSMRIGVKNSHSGTPYLGNMTIVSGGWNTVSYNAQVTEDGTYSVWLDFPSTIAESTKILVDDVTMANETETVHADSRINALETRIAMTSEGVRVGKIENGTFQGTSALINSEGSFDIRQGEETVTTLKSDYVGLMRDSDTNKYRFGVRPYKVHEETSVVYHWEGVDLQTIGGFSLNGIPAAPASDILTIRPSQMTGNNYFIKFNVDALKNDNAIFLDAAFHHREYYQRLDEGKSALAVNFKHAVGLTTPADDDYDVSNDHIDTQVMAINPCLYGIQFVVNARKNTANAMLDATVKVKKTGESTWINSSALPAFRAIETGDPMGWLTRASPMYFVRLDVGYRFGVYISGSTNDFTIGSLNKIIITRMPFSGERMDQ